MNRTLPGSGGWTDGGDPTVTQIHFKRLALGMLTDRRWLQRESSCYVIMLAECWSTMWTRWDRSPRFALVDMNACDGERGKERWERAVVSSVFTLKLLGTLTALRQAANLRGEIQNWNTKELKLQWKEKQFTIWWSEEMTALSDKQFNLSKFSSNCEAVRIFSEHQIDLFQQSRRLNNVRASSGN